MTTLELHNQTIELTLESGQSAHYLLFNPEGGKLRICQKAGSSLLLHVITIAPNACGQTEIIVEQAERDCNTQIYGLSLLKDQQEQELVTRIWHQVGGGKSDQLLKFVLEDNARGSFYGELKVQPDAQKTEAHQTNRNILLSPMAKMATKPQLEIYADDVKCSHGATTGQLDTNALFYMQQRGLSLPQARQLLLAAFLEETLNGLPETEADRFRTLIAENL